tara:strand:+ start:6669 stop:8099 length:1431 start_codon:yes stop_codon:yes gene_type:complete
LLFNSIEFFFFLPTTFLIYWFIVQRNLTIQNLFLIGISYLFYGWWDWRFLSLIIVSSTIDFLIGHHLGKKTDPRTRTKLLIVSLISNIGLLGTFKYFNFFSNSLAESLAIFDISLSPFTLNVVLPVGISFYTFQTLSYTIDIYRNKIKPTSSIISFFAFVAFFPQLVAGPIERAKNLLPQFESKRTFNYEMATDGLKQIVCGLFKKMVIADNCAFYVTTIFDNYTFYSGSTLLVGALFFTFQIYGDFSGYSDIAIGTAKLFGFKLMKNFNFPYFSRDIAEFWRRWHISLSSWFRDYLYIPMGGNRGSQKKVIRNVMITFIISGFWHGANWTFIAWGTINGLYFIPLLLAKKHKEHIRIVAESRWFPSAKEVLQITTTFGLTTLTWVIFRSPTIADAWGYISSIFSKTLLTLPEIRPTNIILLIIGFVIVEWIQRKKDHLLQFTKINKTGRWAMYYAAVILIGWFGKNQAEFIYFQF